MKIVKIRLGYFPKGGVTEKQLRYIQDLLEENGYGNAYHHHITKYLTRNPYKRITRTSASRLINALKADDKIVFLDSS